MKKFALAFVFAVIPASYAAAQQGALQNVIAATDPALAAAAAAAQSSMPVFTVPPPVSIDPSKTPEVPPSQYLPLDKRAVLEYEYTSSEFTDPKVVRVEYISYSEKDAAALVNLIIFNKSRPKVSNFTVTAGRDGYRSTDSPLRGPRLEFPLPLSYNASWDEGPDHSRVAALNAKVTVPAGAYSGCLRIVTRLSGGDAGSAERYYAPGVGLVYERVISEERQEVLKLVSYQLK